MPLITSSPFAALAMYERTLKLVVLNKHPFNPEGILKTLQANRNIIR
jgi:hypothetical protein